MEVSNKVPLVRVETLKFLIACLKTPPTKTKPIITKELVKPTARLLLTALEDSIGEVRTAGAEGMGLLFGIVGERTIQPFLAKLDSVKLQKVKDFIPKEGNPIGPNGPIQSPTPKPKIVPKTPNIKDLDKKSPAKPGPVKPGKPAIQPKKPTPKEPKPKNTVVKVDDSIDYSPLISEEDALIKAEKILSYSLQQQLGDSNWQSRLDAMDDSSRTIAALNINTLADSSDALIRQFLTKPGVKV